MCIFLIWNTNKCESCVISGRDPISDFKITSVTWHLISETAFHARGRSILLWLGMEVVSINILSIHLKKECIRSPSWKNLNDVCEALNVKHEANQVQTCYLYSVLWLWLEVVRCSCFCWFFLCSNHALVYIIVFKLDMVT